MSRLQLHLIRFLFSAFLPPSDEAVSNEDYYVLLGVNNRTCKPDDIRKAYKKKSLQYHPDKVAQFATAHNKTQEEIQTEFVKIKEAYETLSDPKKRNAYDVLGLEGGRMISGIRENEGGLQMHQLVYNLARASCTDKMKLFTLVTLAAILMLIGPILVCLKVDASQGAGLHDAQWILLLIPIWLLNSLYLFFIFPAPFASLKMVSLFCLEVMLALKWDATLKESYKIVLIPLYIHQGLALLESIVIIFQVRRDVSRMVTIQYLERNILPNFNTDGNGDVEAEEGNARSGGIRLYADLTDEEREEINETYIIISEDPDEAGSQQDEEINENDDALSKMKEELKLMYAIAQSEEFAYASKIRSEALKAIALKCFIWVPFLILLVLKLDGEKDWDWNIVFTPLWIEIICLSLYNCWGACCIRTRDRADSAEELDDIEIVEIGGDDDEDPVDVEKNSEGIGGSGSSPSPNISLAFGKIISDAEDIKEDIAEEEATHDKSDPEGIEDGGVKPSQQQNENRAEEQDFEDDSDIPLGDSATAEKHAKALGSCCYYIFLIIGMALFVVKLNGGDDDDTDGQGEYSALWILFPLFLIATFIMCLCACCIFATPAQTMENMMGKSGENANNGNTATATADPVVETPVDTPSNIEDVGKTTPTENSSSLFETSGDVTSKYTDNPMVSEAKTGNHEENFLDGRDEDDMNDID